MSSHLFKTDLHRPRFFIGEIMGLVVAVAVALVWPRFFIPALFLAFVWFLCKIGLSLVLSVILVAVVLSVVLPMLMRPIIMH